jgi:hypothetical protein
MAARLYEILNGGHDVNKKPKPASLRINGLRLNKRPFLLNRTLLIRITLNVCNDYGCSAFITASPNNWLWTAPYHELVRKD